jgi:hypothetical protein
VSLAGFVFQARSLNHSDISPSLESITCERLGGNYRTRYAFGYNVTMADLYSVKGLKSRSPKQRVAMIICCKRSARPSARNARARTLRAPAPRDEYQLLSVRTFTPVTRK